MLRNNAVGLAVVVLSSFCGVAAFADNQQTVDRVFAEIRQGKLENTGLLVRLGEAAVPEIARYAVDGDVAVRGETIAVLQQIGGDAACRAMEPSLNDSASEVRAKAISAYFQRCDHSQVPCEYLLPGVAKMQPSGLAIAAAGYCGEEAVALLMRMLRGNVLVRSEAGGALLVPRNLAASIGLRIAGQEAQEVRIRTALHSKASVVEPEFVLRMLPDLPDSVAREALPLLQDERALPSARRLQDAAVDAFVARLHLKVAFEHGRTRRYTPEEIEQVRVAAAAAFIP
ncbi:hypothetical protein F183_A04230 [Bryobacterales bacterium F-183]|nr:hypothetical protein F183_A04230 [Bryobacterales bacterium F-183]